MLSPHIIIITMKRMLASYVVPLTLHYAKNLNLPVQPTIGNRMDGWKMQIEISLIAVVVIAVLPHIWCLIIT